VVALKPKPEALRAWCTTLATLSRALLGTQPVQVQSPPMRSFSMSTTRAPARAANRAAVIPPDPAPMTTRSQDPVTSDSFPQVTFALRRTSRTQDKPTEIA